MDTLYGWEEHCEYEANAQEDYNRELWAAELESMSHEGEMAEYDNEEAIRIDAEQPLNFEGDSHEAV